MTDSACFNSKSGKKCSISYNRVRCFSAPRRIPSNEKMGGTLNEKELEQLVKLRPLLESYSSVAAARSRPPVIDEESGPPATAEGLSRFIHEVEREIQALESRRGHPKLVNGTPSQFSSNAPYLYAVGLEILTAPLPIVAVGKSFPHDSQRTPDQPSLDKAAANAKRERVKVDVVADEQWIRVVT
jgi:hypothetical protein